MEQSFINRRKFEPFVVVSIIEVCVDKPEKICFYPERLMGGPND